MIRLENITKSYGSKVALAVESLAINTGEVVGLVGNNGAGKTTMFSVILDLINPNQGVAYSKDIVIAGSDHWKSYTGSYVSENFLLEFLTPDEYFKFISELHHFSSSDLSTFLDQFEDLFNNEIRGVQKYIRDLSKGNQKKTGIVAALIGEPDVIILDEPFANLDPTTQIRLKTTIKNLRSPDKTILISSHDLTHVTEVSDRIILLENGLVIKDLVKTEETLRELESYFQVI